MDAKAKTVKEGLFFDLPAELRNVVYDELFTFGPPKFRTQKKRDVVLCHPEILSVCRQIHEEANKMFQEAIGRETFPLLIKFSHQGLDDPEAEWYKVALNGWELRTNIGRSSDRHSDAIFWPGWLQLVTSLKVTLQLPLPEDCPWLKRLKSRPGIVVDKMSRKEREMYRGEKEKADQKKVEYAHLILTDLYDAMVGASLCRLEFDLVSCAEWYYEIPASNLGSPICLIAATLPKDASTTSPRASTYFNMQRATNHIRQLQQIREEVELCHTLRNKLTSSHQGNILRVLEPLVVEPGQDLPTLYNVKDVRDLQQGVEQAQAYIYETADEEFEQMVQNVVEKWERLRKVRAVRRAEEY